MRTPQDEGSGVTLEMDTRKIHCVAMYVELFLKSHCMLGTDSGDSGYQCMTVDIGNKRNANLVVTKITECAPGPKLHFIGKVGTAVGGKGTLPLVTAFGIDLFVSVGPHSSPTSEFFVPAWAVRTVASKPTMMLGSKKVPFDISLHDTNIVRRIDEVATWDLDGHFPTLAEGTKKEDGVELTWCDTRNKRKFESNDNLLDAIGAAGWWARAQSEAGGRRGGHPRRRQQGGGTETPPDVGELVCHFGVLR